MQNGRRERGRECLLHTGKRKRTKRATIVSRKTRHFAHPITPKPGVLGTPVRAARPDPSLRNRGLLRVTNQIEPLPTASSCHNNLDFRRRLQLNVSQ